MKLKPILSECWTGYKQVGLKNKGGRQVPNCVPVTESTKDDIIKDLDKVRTDLIKKVDVLIAKKKKLYSDVDITTPMSADEKQLDKDIQSVFSQIQQIIQQKRSLKENQAVSGGKVHKLITGKNLKFKGKSYNQIDFETLGVDNSNGTIRLRILAPKEIFGNEMSLDFKTIRRGPFFKTDTSNQLSEGSFYSSQQLIQKLTPKIEKDVELLKKEFPNYDIELVKNRYERDGSYTLSISGKNTSTVDNNKLQKAIKSKIKESVNEEKVYIDYLNKQKGFKQDRIKFNSYEEAVKWARKNFEKFNPDMIKYESVNEISSNVPKIFVKTAAVEKKIKELMADRKRAVVPYNKETDPKKKEILKQILIKLTSQIKGYEKNLIQLRDMEEEYIQQMNADAELEVESKN